VREERRGRLISERGRRRRLRIETKVPAATDSVLAVDATGTDRRCHPEVAGWGLLRPSRADTMMDMARPTRTPRAIATIVSTVVIRVVVPVLTPSSKALLPCGAARPAGRT
jgi:hypothetical protein